MHIFFCQRQIKKKIILPSDTVYDTLETHDVQKFAGFEYLDKTKLETQKI